MLLRGCIQTANTHSDSALLCRVDYKHLLAMLLTREGGRGVHRNSWFESHTGIALHNRLQRPSL
jgi:hypothetical protein